MVRAPPALGAFVFSASCCFRAACGLPALLRSPPAAAQPRPARPLSPAAAPPRAAGSQRQPGAAEAAGAPCSLPLRRAAAPQPFRRWPLTLAGGPAQMAQQSVQQYVQLLTDRVRTECFDRCAAAALGRAPPANGACSWADPASAYAGVSRRRARRCPRASRAASATASTATSVRRRPPPRPVPSPSSCCGPAASCLLQPELTPAGCAQRR